MALQESSAANFLTNEERFVLGSDFELVEHYDDHVIGYEGTQMPLVAQQILQAGLGQTLPVRVKLFFMDNSDIGCPRTYRVELAVVDPIVIDSRPVHAYGQSSRACPDLSVAFTEAAICCVMNVRVVPESRCIAHMRRARD